MSGDSLGRISPFSFVIASPCFQAAFSYRRKAGYPEQGGLRGLKVEDFELPGQQFRIGAGSSDFGSPFPGAGDPEMGERLHLPLWWLSGRFALPLQGRGLWVASGAP